jgi:hypothetical protein
MHEEIGESCTSYASVNITTFTSVPLHVKPIPEQRIICERKSAAAQVALVVLGEPG